MDKWQAWTTLVGAVIAGITGAVNLYRSIKTDSDSILVKWGSINPSASPTTDMYIVNTSKHSVQIKDFGFVLSDGKLFSIAWYNETEGHMDGGSPHDYYQGTTLIQPKESFALGFQTVETTIGAYALTITQKRAVIDMRKSLLNPSVFLVWIKAKSRTNF